MDTPFAEDAFSKTGDTINDEVAAALDRLSDYIPARRENGHPRDDAFTVKMASEKWGITGDAARNRLYKMVDEGVLVMEGGGIGYTHWYWFKE
jgi:hypothetical protein